MTLALAGLPLLAMCSDKGSTPETVTPSEAATTAAAASPTATTSPTSTPEPLPEALQRVLDRVAEIRELDVPSSVNVEFVSRSDLPALLDRLTTEADRAWFAKLTDLYRLLGHLRNDQTYLQVYQSFGGDAVLGLYSPPEKTLWVVHDDGEAPEIDNLSKPLEETLAHEFVHALQDYHFDLVNGDAAFQDNLDVSQVYTAVIEGDAVTTEQSYSQRYLALPSGAAIVASASAQLPDVPPSIIRELYFPYTTGAEWVRNARQQGGSAQIDAWLTDPPAGTTFVLHPDLLTSGFQPADITLPDLAGALGDGWDLGWSSPMGEFNLRNYLQLHARASASANAAAGWAGDRFDLYRKGDETVAAFRFRFMDDAEAQEFADTYNDFLDGSRAEITRDGDITFAEMQDGDVVAVAPRQGADVLFAIGSNRDLAARALDALLHG
jgi:hypothetical protein